MGIAAFLLVSANMLFVACNEEDWTPEDTILTDASYGSLTNHHVVATGDVQNVTSNSATILFSANFNYKSEIKSVGVIFSQYEFSRDELYKYSDTWYENDYMVINDFTNSKCEITLDNLKPNTKYFYCACADVIDNFHGSRNMQLGEVKSFTTSFNNIPGEAVDLGLSVKWANRNIGANQPEDAGAGFYWGGTEPCHKSYHADWHDFSLTTLKNQGYIDDDDNLCPAYDAATQIWGNEWRMPTWDELDELWKDCSRRRTTMNGEKVFLVTGPNGNYIYMPAEENYWSSTYYSISDAFCLDFDEYYSYYHGKKVEGCYCVRPVLK